MNEMVEMTLMEYEENLEKIYNRYLDNLLMIRVGRANPKLIENIKVDGVKKKNVLEILFHRYTFC